MWEGGERGGNSFSLGRWKWGPSVCFLPCVRLPYLFWGGVGDSGGKTRRAVRYCKVGRRVGCYLFGAPTTVGSVDGAHSLLCGLVREWDRDVGTIDGSFTERFGRYPKMVEKKQTSREPTRRRAGGLAMFSSLQMFYCASAVKRTSKR